MTDISASVKLSKGLNRMELYENNILPSQRAIISTCIVKQFLCGPLFTDLKKNRLKMYIL